MFSDLSPEQIQIILFLSFLTVSALSVVIFTIAFIRIFKAEPEKAKAFFDLAKADHNGIKLITVAFVVTAAVTAAIIDKLDDGLIAILSSIVGYVLGGLSANKNTD